MKLEYLTYFRNRALLTLCRKTEMIKFFSWMTNWSGLFWKVELWRREMESELVDLFPGLKKDAESDDARISGGVIVCVRYWRCTFRITSLRLNWKLHHRRFLRYQRGRILFFWYVRKFKSATVIVPDSWMRVQAEWRELCDKTAKVSVCFSTSCLCQTGLSDAAMKM